MEPDIKQVETLTEAENILLQLGRIQRLATEIKGKLNNEVEDAKARYKETLEPLANNAKKMEKLLGDYVKSHRRTVLKNRKTRQLAYGTVGLRKSTAIKPQPKKKVADILDGLKAKNAYDAIRVRESVDKEKLRQWSDEELAEVNARRVTREEFFYTVDESQIGDNNEP